MTDIISLMCDLDLSDDVITNTITKINLICARNDYSYDTLKTSRSLICGNGNGNGNGNN